MQAGERTSHLFRLANHHGGLVVGTGDLSELALGWTTYGVGDQMSHYNVNASVPKTLIQYLIALGRSDRASFDADTSGVLQAILDTDISPELVPGGRRRRGATARPEHRGATIGPYELQDFHLYYLSAATASAPARSPSWPTTPGATSERGGWPPDFPEAKQHEYDLATIKRWLERLPRPLLPDQPVQALGDAQRSQGRLRRLAVAARRLARAVRRLVAPVDRRAAGERAGRGVSGRAVRGVSRRGGRCA